MMPEGLSDRFKQLKHLPDDLARPSTAPPDDANVPHGTAAPDDAPHLSYHEQKRAAEYDIVVAALEANDWLKVRTARALKLSDHSSLIKIMNRLEISRPTR